MPKRSWLRHRPAINPLLVLLLVGTCSSACTASAEFPLSGKTTVTENPSGSDADGGAGGSSTPDGGGGDGGADAASPTVTPGPAGCSPSTSTSLNSFITGLKPAPIAAAQPLTMTSQSSACSADGNPGCCVTATTEAWAGTASTDAVIAFDPNASTLWPGSLVQGSSLSSGVLAAISAPRAPGVITVTSLFPSGGVAPFVSEAVAEPSLASVTNAMNDILAKNYQSLVPAQVDFTTVDAASLDEAEFKLGFASNWFTASEAASLSFKSTSYSHEFYAKLVQRYYSVSFSQPASPTGLFCDGVTSSDLANYTGQGNPPAYVATVTYGRMAIVRIESNATSADMQAAFSSALDAGLVNGSLNVSDATRSVLQNSKSSVVVIGGSGSSALELAANPASALSAWMAAGASYSLASPGAPISYVVNYAADNTPARISYSTQFTVNSTGSEQCTPVTEVLLPGPLTGNFAKKLTGTHTYTYGDSSSGALILNAQTSGTIPCTMDFKNQSDTIIKHFDNVAGGQTQTAAISLAGVSRVHVAMYAPVGFLGTWLGVGDAYIDVPQNGSVSLTNVCGQ